MPRTLPWTIHRESTHVAPPRRSVDSPKPTKRARVSDIDLEGEKGATPPSTKKPKAPIPSEHSPLRHTHIYIIADREADGDIPPSSPPPEPLPEVFMHEGIEKDDKYRMVEDEFLATAQQFTVHLHAAEYKRREKIARARNAETISSISRPVTQAMPDHTKRKIEAMKRSKVQQDAIQTLFERNTEDPDDSSDGEGLAYFNTTLRGLMDSPRRQAATLSKIPLGIDTRAAAGFQRPAIHRDRKSIQVAESPRPKHSRQLGQSSKPNQDSSTESSDFEDDLDAPVPAASNPSRRRIFPTSSSPSSMQPLQTTQQKSSAAHKPAPQHLASETKQDPKFNSSSPQSTLASPDRTTLRVRRRFEQSRLDQGEVKQEKDEDKKPKDLNLIPTFL